MIGTILAASLAALPTADECRDAALDPEAVLAQSVGLQGFIYGYPIVDLLKQRHNETHRIRPDQPVASRINTIGIYPGVLTPKTQGQLRAANADTLYLNAWVDLSKGPVLLEVPEMGRRYYTLAFMDLYAKPHHLGTRTNGGKATKYALVGPSGGAVPDGYEAFRLPTDTAWMLGRVLAQDAQDEAEAKRLAQSIVMRGVTGPEVTDAQPASPFTSLEYFTVLNQALKTLPPLAAEAALLAGFDTAGFGPNQNFDLARLSPAQTKGLGCALRLGPQVLAKRGFKPTQSTNGWLLSSAVGDPGFDYLLRAEVARGGYVNDPAESIYPAAITDSKGAMLNGANNYRIHFPKGTLPPVNGFWSITTYDMRTSQLVENKLGRYAIGDRTKGLRFGKDGSLDIYLASTKPPQGTSNWLPVPPGSFQVVARLYLPSADALSGKYVLPTVDRLEKGS